MIKYLYLLNFSIMFAYLTIQSAELKTLKLSKPVTYQAIPFVQVDQEPPSKKHCLRNSNVVRACASLLIGLVTLIVIVSPNKTCTHYSQALVNTCSNDCSKGFQLSNLCHIPTADVQSATAQLKTVCIGNQPEIQHYQVCSRSSQPPCSPFEPAVQQLNKTCNPQPTKEEIRQRYYEKLAALAKQRKPGRIARIVPFF